MASIQGDLNTNLTSVWLSDSSGLTTDLHGSNDLTNSGVVLTTGVQGDAGDFERSDTTDYLTIADGSQTDLDFGSNDFTVALWINLESQPASSENYTMVFKRGSHVGYGFDYRESGGTKYLRFLTGNGSGFDSVQIAQTLNSSTDYLLVVTKSGTTGTIYVNASSIGTGTLSATVSDSGTAFFIGNAATGGDDPFDGVENQVAIWNGTALNGTQINTLYNSGSGIPYAAPATSKPQIIMI